MNTLKRKQLTFITGHFEGMTPVEIIENTVHRVKKRSVVTLSTEDGQTLYLETRDAVITKIQKLGFIANDLVIAGIVFIGSEKNGRCYNNLFLNDIDYARKE